MSSKDIAFIEELFPTEGGATVSYVSNCKTLELSKNAKQQERILGITEMRICIVKSRLVGRSCENSYLWTEMSKLSIENSNTIRFTFKTSEGNHVFDIISDDERDIQSIIQSIILSIDQLKQCIHISPDINLNSTNIIFNEEKNNTNDDIQLAYVDGFILAYKMHSAIEKRPIDPFLLEEFTKLIEFSASEIETLDDDTDTVLELDDLLRYIITTKHQKKYIPNPIDIAIILRSLLKVPVFITYHLDRLPLDLIHMKIISRLLSNKDQIIRHLAVRNCGITTEHIKCLFKHFTNTDPIQLQSLCLNNNSITDPAFFQAFDASKLQVRRFYISNCQLTEKCVSALVELLLSKPWQDKHVGLVKVDLSQNSFRDSAAIICTHLGRYLKTNAGFLDAFNFKDCHLPLNFLEDVVLNTGLLLERLQMLECGGNEMTIYGANGLSRLLKQSKALRYLSVRDINMAAEMITEMLIGALANNGDETPRIMIDFSLTTNEIDENRPKVITNALKALSKQACGKCLKGLAFGNNGLYDLFPEFIQALTHVKSLEKVVLDYNFDAKKKGGNLEFIKCLVQTLEKLPNITELEIRGNPEEKQKMYLTYKELQPLFEYLKKDTKLKSIVLDGNKIEDGGCALLAAALVSNEALESISIEDCKINIKGIEHLLKAVSTASNTNLQYLLPNRTMNRIQETAGKKDWKRVSELISQVLPILRRNIDNKTKMPTPQFTQRQSVTLANRPNATRSIQQLANLLEGKPLLANKKYEAKEFSYGRSKTKLDVGDEKHDPVPMLKPPKIKGSSPARFRAFSSGIVIETKKDVADLKMEAPTNSEKRHKRTRKKIRIE